MLSDGAVVSANILPALGADPLELDTAVFTEPVMIRVVPFVLTFWTLFESFLVDDTLPADVILVAATILRIILRTSDADSLVVLMPCKMAGLADGNSILEIEIGIPMV